MSRAPVAVLASVVAALMAGCGGGGGGGDSAGTSTGAGGGGGSTVASTGTFALQTGYGARLAAGSTDNFTISGTCAGSAKISNTAAAAAMFEGVSAVATTQSSTVNFSNCLPATSSASGTSYYNATYAPLGTSVTGIEYSKSAAAPTPLPASVKVGDTGVYATLTTYADSTKAATTGQRVLSYTIEADTASTVIANLDAKTYDTSNQLLLTQQTRYRVATDGTLTLVTIDVQYNTSSKAHLLYTKV